MKKILLFAFSFIVCFAYSQNILFNSIPQNVSTRKAMTTLVIGNSIAAQSQWKSAVGGYWQTNSDVHYANALAGNPMIFNRVTASTRMDGYCVYGYSGQSLVTILTDLPSQVFTPLANEKITPDCVWGHSLLENDLTQGSSTVTIVSAINQFVRDIQGRYPGAILVLSTPRPNVTYTGSIVANYQAIVSYVQSLDNNYNIFVTTLNAYEDSGSPGNPLSGYTADGTHPNAKGALLLARTEAATFNRIAANWKQPYFDVSTNMALSGTGSASGTNVTGTVPTSVTIAGAATATFVGVAEQPGFTESVSISSGTTVGAFIDIARTDFGIGSITSNGAFQFSSFVKIQIVSGAQNINGIKLHPRIIDASGNPFINYITPQTGDAQPIFINGDIFTFIMPPQIAVTEPITSVQNYIRLVPALIQDGTGFKVRVISQGVGIIQSTSTNLFVAGTGSVQNTFTVGGTFNAQGAVIVTGALNTASTFTATGPSVMTGGITTPSVAGSGTLSLAPSTSSAGISMTNTLVTITPSMNIGNAVANATTFGLARFGQGSSYMDIGSNGAYASLWGNQTTNNGNNFGVNISANHLLLNAPSSTGSVVISAGNSNNSFVVTNTKNVILNPTMIGSAASPSQTLQVAGNFSCSSTGAFGGNVSLPHLVGNSTTPTATVGVGAGSGATFTLTGNDAAGFLDITTAGTPTGSNATVITVTFNSAYGAAPVVVITPSGPNSAALNGTTQIYVDSQSTTTTTFVIKSGTVGLTTGTIYRFSYQVIGK